MKWRKKKPRNINYTPTLTVRRPVDVQIGAESIMLGHDELEALRLKNLNDLGIISAAKQMNISKSLFAKIHNEALKKVSTALVHGKPLHIETIATEGQTQENDFHEPII